MNILKKIGNAFLILLGTILVLSGLLSAKLNDTDFQNYLTQRFTKYLSQKLNTDVRIDHVSYKLFHKFSLNNFLIKDLNNDTLIYSQNIDVEVAFINLLEKRFVINKIDLNNSQVYLHRGRNGDYTFQFIIDALGDTTSSASTDSSSSREENALVYLQLDRVELQKMHLVLLDEPNGTMLNFQFPKTNIEIEKLDLNQPQIELRDLLFENADLQVSKIAPLEIPGNPVVTSAHLLPDTAVIHINTQPVKLFVKNLQFKNSRFTYDDTAEPVTQNQFDSFHQSYKDLNLQFSNASMIMDTIKAKIDNISFEEKSGFKVNHMKCEARVTPKSAEAKMLSIITPNSELNNFFSMSYLNFHSFFDYNSSVVMKAILKSSTISTTDISYFFPQLKSNKELVQANGIFEGTVDHIHGKNLKLHTGSVTELEGDFDLNGLPETEETYIDFHAERLTTDFQDIRKLIPAISFPGQLSRLGKVSFKGSFTGFFNDFVAYGNFNTAIGELTSDVNMKLNTRFDNATYGGHLIARDFNIGAYGGNDSLFGPVSFDALIEGEGLSLENIDAKLNGSISKLTFNNYQYQNILMNGEFQKKYFTGKVLMADSNIHLDFTGSVDLNQALPVFDFKALINNARLNELKLSRENYSLSTQIDINMTGNNIDNFIGYAKTINTTFSKADQTLFMDTIALHVTESNGVKTFSFKSQPVSANFKGALTLTELPNTFLFVLNQYFPSLPLRYRHDMVLEDLDFDINVKDSKPAFSFFVPSWQGINNSFVKGHFNSTTNTIAFTGFIPFLKYQTLSLDSLHFNATTSGNSFHFVSMATDMKIGDSIHIFTPVFESSVGNDTMHFNLRTEETKKNSLNVFAALTGDTFGIRIHFLPSNFILNHLIWKVSDNNLVTYSLEQLQFFNFTISNENRFLTISNGDFQQRATNLHFNFQDLPMVDLYNFVRIEGIDLKGNLSGSMEALNIFHKPRFRANTIMDNLTLNNQHIKRVKSDIDFKPRGDMVLVNLETEDSAYDFQVEGVLNPGRVDSQLNLSININRMDLRLGESFIPDILSDSRGNAKGKLLLSGTFTNPLLTGQLFIPSLSTKVNYLQTTYHLKNEKITFYEDYIELDSIKLYDENNDIAIAHGEIVHDHLRNFNLNLSVFSNRILGLKTTEKDNDLFYGTAEVGGLIQFLGPPDNMEIRAVISSKKGSSIAVPVDYTTSVSNQSFIRFKKHGVPENNFRGISEIKPGLTLNFNLDLTPDANIQIIFDKKAGDIVRGTGLGNIRMEIDTRGDFNMYGTYNIQKGDYLFTKLNFFNKYFTIERGGTVSFSGNPYDAQINISAIYKTRASVADLVSGTSVSFNEQDRKELEQRLPVDVYLKLTGSLLLPDITFDIRLPDINTINSTAYQQLEKVKQDQNELNKQVFGLMVLGRFLPTASGLGNQNVGTDVNNSVSEFLLNQLSYWTSQINKDVNFKFDYSSYESSLNATNPNDVTKRNELQAAITYRLFNDRLALEAGGNFDFGGQPQSGSTSNTNNFAGDFALDYEVTPDGRIVAKAFSKSQYDVVDERYKTKNGISLSFQKEFDKLKELFKKQR
ncbi:MAG: translocation/assembly module TamB domain-containing protein [Chitinophagales bacterium]|nr:translocation/assembly module TamB domain-containing protein [Chitinophagales bacterium]